MGGAIPCHPSNPRRDLRPNHNGRSGAPSDVAHLKLEEVLCLTHQKERVRAPDEMTRQNNQSKNNRGRNGSFIDS
ncbi:hypothetical protein BHE74_00041649 [Ensete ventricosum]|nr:hypothetical protein BHE74_00041649 [Ensete ventricosum]